MDHRKAGRYWDDNADAWSELSRAGYNTSRDRVLNPCFFAMLPDVQGLAGLDIGCGDGDNTRLVAERGASMTGLDIAARFVAIAEETERTDPIGVQYVCGSAVELPFPDETFDFTAPPRLPRHSRGKGLTDAVLARWPPPSSVPPHAGACTRRGNTMREVLRAS